jgi:hypothetical protein
MAKNPRDRRHILTVEGQLLDSIEAREKKIADLQAQGVKNSDKRIKNLRKEIDLQGDKLDTLKLQHSEQFASLKLSKELIKQAQEHRNVLINQSGVMTGLRSLGASINKEAKKTDKLSKKLTQAYMTAVDLTSSVFLNTKSIGTEEFQQLNITSQIVKLKKLESEVTGNTRKLELKAAIEHLELMKESQDILATMHKSSQAAAKSIVSPFKKIVDTMGQVPVVGGLIQSAFNLDEIEEQLAGRIGKAMASGIEKAPADIGKKAFQDFRSSKSKKAGGEGYKKGMWDEEKKKREESAKITDKDLKTARLKQGMMKASIAGLAVVAGLWAKIGKYAFDAGLSLAQVGKLGPQLIINSKAVEAFAEEFGTVGELSTGLSWELRKQRFLYGAAEKDVAKLMKLQQGMTGATKESISADLPGMYKEARKAGVSPAKLMETMAGSSEFLAKYVSGSVKEMGKFAIAAAKGGVSLQAIEASMKGALDWETSIGKEMEASMLLGREINLDRFRQLAFAGDAEGAMAEQLRILKSFGPLENLRIDQKEMIGDLFNTEFGQLVSMQREQDILNSAVGQQQSLWQSVVGTSGTALATMGGMLPVTSQIGMTFSGLGISLKGILGKLKSMKVVQTALAALGMRTAAAEVVGAGAAAGKSAAKIPYIGWLLAAGAIGSIMTLGFQWLAKGKAKGKAMGGPVQGMNPYMVGERGPELFIPATGGNIIPNNRLAGGTADRVYGDTSKQDAKFDTMIGLLQQANTDRVSGTKKLGGQFEYGMGQH